MGEKITEYQAWVFGHGILYGGGVYGVNPHGMCNDVLLFWAIYTSASYLFAKKVVSCQLDPMQISCSYIGVADSLG